eukprot:1839646-Rhodomonas_salina.1
MSFRTAFSPPPEKLTPTTASTFRSAKERERVPPSQAPESGGGAETNKGVCANVSSGVEDSVGAGRNTGRQEVWEEREEGNPKVESPWSVTKENGRELIEGNGGEGERAAREEHVKEEAERRGEEEEKREEEAESGREEVTEEETREEEEKEEE